MAQSIVAVEYADCISAERDGVPFAQLAVAVEYAHCISAISNLIFVNKTKESITVVFACQQVRDRSDIVSILLSTSRCANCTDSLDAHTYKLSLSQQSLRRQPVSLPS